MRIIVVIQHAQSEHHTNGMVGSWADWDLTEIGVLQAESIGQNLARTFPGVPFTMYTSDLLRASHTAELIGVEMGLIPIPVSALRERNLGKCVGQSVAWMNQHKEAEETTIDDRMFSDAESRRDEWNRLLPFYEEKIRGTDKNIILVSHGDLISAFSTMFLGLEPETMDSFGLWGLAGGVSIFLEQDDGKRLIKSFSDMSFLI